MKTLKVYERKVLERTGFRKYPYKEVTQYVVTYGDKQFKNNHYESVDNPKLRIKFKEVLNKILKRSDFIDIKAFI